MVSIGIRVKLKSKIYVVVLRNKDTWKSSNVMNLNVEGSGALNMKRMHFFLLRYVFLHLFYSFVVNLCLLNSICESSIEVSVYGVFFYRKSVGGLRHIEVSSCKVDGAICS